ncbi:MAG: hypothetical protein RLZZ555_819 [Pseudomonadota bacterium]|jgi:hypothetical protein
MTKKFRLVVSNTLGFDVVGRINEEGPRPLDVRFRITADRIDVSEYRDVLAEGSAVTTRDFLAAHLRGWSGQRLVLDEQDQPAEYSVEALDVMLSLVGMERLILGAYLDKLAVSATPEGRAKN